MILAFSNIKKIILTIISLLACGLAIGQEDSTSVAANPFIITEGIVTIDSDPNIEKLITAKIKSNRNPKNNEFYRIQIYNGPLDGAEKTKKEFKRKYYDWSCDISFESPNYKVRVGKFRARLEADKYLLEIRKKYSNAFLLTP